MYYYITPKYNVALNAKVGSSTLARSIIREFYPEKNKEILQTKTPPNILENDKQWHWLCPGTHNPDKDIVLFVRDPISRFLSACQQVGITQTDLDTAIDSLINDNYFIRTPIVSMGSPSKEDKIKNINILNQKRYEERLNRINQNLPVKPKFKRIGFIRDDIHFWKQYPYIINKTYCFKFPDYFQEGLKFIGITNNIPIVNKGKKDKLILSDNQKLQIESYYQKDIDLFNSLNESIKIIIP